MRDGPISELDDASNGRVISIDPLAEPRWDAFLAQHPEARLAHSSSWLEVVQRTYGYRPAHLAYESAESILGVLPLVSVRSPLTGSRLVSLPFSGPAGPIGRSPSVIDALVGAALKVTSQGRYSYLNIQSMAGQLTPDDGRLTRLNPFVCSLLPLSDDPVQVWNGIPFKALKQEIKQARTRGVTVSVSDDLADLRAFYELSVQTSRKHGLPPQPYALFESMWGILKPKQMLSLFVATLNDRVIGAQICFQFKDIFSAGYVGTDYRALKYYHPIKLLDWSAIEWACSNGFRHFDLLQSHVRNEGLRWYKRSFGAIEVPVTYYYFPKVGSTAVLRDVLVGRRWGVGKLVQPVLRRLPTTGLKMVGNSIFRHMG